MQLSDTVRAELERELRVLRRARDDAEEQISAIETILKPIADPSPGLLNSLSSRPIAVEEDIREMGLRDAIRAILSQSSKGMRPRDVADVLIKQGFKSPAATALKTRVANEMWRLGTQKKLQNKKGKYSLVQEAVDPT